MAGLIALATKLIFGALWLGLMVFLRLRKGWSLARLALLALFGVYLYAVLDLTILQFQSLLVLRLFNTDLILRGVEGEEALNLIPLVTLGPGDLRTSLLNILMTVPFGLGLPLFTRFRFWRVAGAGLLLSLAIEALQFVTGAIAGTTFRIADINDVLFNTAGAAIGYLLLALAVRLFGFPRPETRGA